MRILPNARNILYFPDPGPLSLDFDYVSEMEEFIQFILLIKRNGFTESKQSQYLRATSAAIMNIIKSLESLLKQLSSALLQLFFPSSKRGGEILFA